MEKAKLNYRIVCIADSLVKKGFVDVVLDPIDKNIFKQQNSQQRNPAMTVMSKEFPMSMGQMGMMVQEIPHMMEDMMGIKKKKNDPRMILWVEDSVDFASRSWKWGDIIEVSLKKIGNDNGEVKDAAGID